MPWFQKVRRERPKVRGGLRSRLEQWNGGALAEPLAPKPPPAPPPSEGIALENLPDTTGRPSVRPNKAGRRSTRPGEADHASFEREVNDLSSAELDAAGCPSFERLERVIPGTGGRIDPFGDYYLIDSPLSAHPDCPRLDERFLDGWSRCVPPRAGDLRRLHRLDPAGWLFLDIETTGLGDCMVFLVGLMRWDGRRFSARQLLARSGAEEAGILAAAARDIERSEALISFNGKSFDLPFLQNRGRRRLITIDEPPLHVDLLHHARRRYARSLPNCRLQTLEERLCGRTRVGDVPSREIPRVYRRYLRDGDPAPLQPILHHNLIDLATMADLLVMMYGGATAGPPGG